MPDAGIKQIILIEPYAHREHGHMREKLELWLRGLDDCGVTPVVVSFEPTTLGAGRFRSLTPSRWVRSAARLFRREKYWGIWLDFWTYLTAFRLAAREDVALVGLTASNLSTVALAARWASPPKIWKQVIMDGGLAREGQRLILRPRAERALRVLLRHGCQLWCNSHVTVEVLQKIFGPDGEIQYLPDPMFVVDEAIENVGHGRRGVFVSGADDWRRSAMAHACAVEWDPPLERLTLHRAGTGLIQDWPPSLGRVEPVDNYLAVEELCALIQQHRAVLMAYSPDFLSGSGNLALAVAAGTPVLTSDFPYARQLHDRYGRIGEMFAYKDSADMLEAWRRLSGWGEGEWKEFTEARQRLVADCRYDAVVRRILLRPGSAVSSDDPSDKTAMVGGVSR